MHVLNYRRNVLLKLAWRHAAALPRALRRRSASPTAYRDHPPVLANSFPKSGTHLLLQILKSVPGLRDWGDFWASQPSFSFREPPPAAMAARIAQVAPAELVCGHLYASEPVARALRARSVVHFFIYRDPRDVVVSEAHYLAKMNRWHRLHSRFSRLPSQSDRIMLAIRGLPRRDLDYPNVAERFARFTAWLDRPDVCAVNYEDLVSDRRRETITNILRFYQQNANRDFDLPALVENASAAIQPERSHTFRRGGSGAWRQEFDPALTAAFKAVGGDLVVRLGYERSLDW